MRKLSMICLSIFSLAGCVAPQEKIEYTPEFRIIEVEGEQMACQSKDNIANLYKKLLQCKENDQ
jgi:uncharacterized lipoprotein YajG